MQANPKVTVLMPVFNAEKYVRDSIKSILDQTFKDFVFLIINDGSDDRSEELILSYKDPQIKYLKNEHNLGITETLNLGIKVADTEYIARMDADDIAVPDRLSSQLAVMDKYHDIGVLGGHMELMGRTGEIWKTPLTHREIHACLAVRCPLSHPTVMIRTSVLKKNNIRYPDQYLHMEDYALWYRLKDITHFRNLDKVLIYYRYSDQNITVAQAETKMSSLVKFYEFMFNNLNIPCSEEDARTHLNFTYKKFNPPEKITLIKYQNWISRLMLTNRKKGLFPEKELVYIIWLTWKSIFYKVIFDLKSTELAHQFMVASAQMPFPFIYLQRLRLIYLKNRIAGKI